MLGRKNRKNRKKPEGARRRFALPAINWRYLGYGALALTVLACGAAGVSWAFNQPIQTVAVEGRFQRVTPAPTWTIMTSRLAMQAVANLIIAVAVVIIGSQIHHISPSAGQYVLVLLVSILAGAVFLSIAQAMVGLVKSADSVQAIARVLFAVLILLGLLGQSGALGSFWSSVARWTPVGAVMTLFAGVLNLHAWYSRDTLALLACLGYIVVFAGIGIRWFQWDAR